MRELWSYKVRFTGSSYVLVPRPGGSINCDDSDAGGFQQDAERDDTPGAIDQSWNHGGGAAAAGDDGAGGIDDARAGDDVPAQGVMLMLHRLCVIVRASLVALSCSCVWRRHLRRFTAAGLCVCACHSACS